MTSVLGIEQKQFALVPGSEAWDCFKMTASTFWRLNLIRCSLQARTVLGLGLSLLMYGQACQSDTAMPASHPVLSFLINIYLSKDLCPVSISELSA